jgi:hypothetical protein
MAVDSMPAELPIACVGTGSRAVPEVRRDARGAPSAPVSRPREHADKRLADLDLVESRQVFHCDDADLGDHAVDRGIRRRVVVVWCLADVDGVEAEDPATPLEQRTTCHDADEGMVEELPLCGNTFGQPMRTRTMVPGPTVSRHG